MTRTGKESNDMEAYERLQIEIIVFPAGDVVTDSDIVTPEAP